MAKAKKKGVRLVRKKRAPRRGISDRFKAKKALKESEANFRTFFESVGDLIFVGNKNGHILFSNSAVKKHLGYSDTELRAMHILDVHPKEFRAEAETIFGAMFRGERSTCPLPLARKDGTILPVETRVWFGKWDGKECVFGLCKDLSAEQEAQQRFERLFRNNPALMALSILPERTFIDVNNAFLNVLGYTREDLLGKTTVELNLFPNPEQQAALGDKLVKDGAIAGYELQVRRKDGVLVNGLFSGELISSQGKQYFLTVMIDMTACKQAEAERDKLLHELHKTQKLEALGLLAAGIAHDFNNLLQGIIGFIEAARIKTKEETIAGYLSKALQTMERASGLTRQMLTFAKGGTPMREITALFPFLEETVRFAVSGSPIACTFRVQDTLWLCSIDKNQISQAVENIVINAQQAMPAGGSIEVSARNIPDHIYGSACVSPENFVCISIQDQGTGIPKEFLPHIFEPFYTTKPKGHGLGLATCYSIIHRHGGHIEVESLPDRGTVFHLYLPASPDAVIAAAAGTIPEHHGCGTFLVMDDEEVVRETAEVMLRTYGYKVVLKENGRDAVDFFAAECRAHRQIAGMIFDLTIPGAMGGKEAVREIRKLSSEIPVFVASGYADDPVMTNPEAFGFTASICKPFKSSDLAKVLNIHAAKS